MKIYIAGPLSSGGKETDDVKMLANVYRAIDSGLAVRKKGHIPFVPHLTYWMDLRAQQTGVKMTWDDYMAMDDAFLQACDALLYLGPSKGADMELERAIRLGLRIFHSVEEIIDLSAPQL